MSVQDYAKLMDDLQEVTANGELQYLRQFVPGVDRYEVTKKVYN